MTVWGELVGQDELVARLQESVLAAGHTLAETRVQHDRDASLAVENSRDAVVGPVAQRSSDAVVGPAVQRSSDA
ncbi:MAG: hypothetical protein H0V07_08970, partial [Propionibacteriales bacterium]|nr:hypothetical protein [Propionibacteriales bacterium]